MIDLRSAATLAGLGVVAAFSWWVLEVSAPIETRSLGPRHLPDYHFTAPRITRFGADGKVALDLTAVRALHFPDDDSVQLEDLRVALTTDAGVTWRMRADRGNAPMGGDSIELAGAVSVSRPRADGGLTLATESLTVEPRAQRLSTTAPVELRAGGSRIAAVGMQADLLAERVALSAQIRGSYAR